MHTNADQSYQQGIKALQDGDFMLAESSFLSATQQDANRYEFWNLLGLTYQFQKKWEDCAHAWEEALRCQPDSNDTKLNLGIACIASNRPQEAEQYWKAVLQSDPENIQSLINLGLFYREREKNQRAHDMWDQALAQEPKLSNVQEWLADVKGVLGMQKIIHQQYDEAEELLKKAVMLDPEYAILWGYLSELHFQRQEFQEAFATCSKGLNIDPENPTLHHTMGNILRMTQQEDQALIAYQKALDCGSRHPATYRAIAELRQSDVDENEEVIQHLFDQYAQNFDQDLLENLSYATPTKAQELFAEYASDIHSLLDLGCGTGLSLLPFQQYLHAEAISVGVDLSSKMLEIAAQKSIYTELHCLSIRDFVMQETKTFDIVLCLDTLVYLRDLDTLFESIKNRVSEHGFFLFSTETTKADTPILQRSGRYAHPNSYILGIVNQQEWELVSHTSSLLRKDGDHWVQGTLWLLRRK